MPSVLTYSSSVAPVGLGLAGILLDDGNGGRLKRAIALAMLRSRAVLGQRGQLDSYQPARSCSSRGSSPTRQSALHRASTRPGTPARPVPRSQASVLFVGEVGLGIDLRRFAKDLDDARIAAPCAPPGGSGAGTRVELG